MREISNSIIFAASRKRKIEEAGVMTSRVHLRLYSQETDPRHLFDAPKLTHVSRVLIMIPSCMKRLVEYIQRDLFNSFCNVASINCCRFMECKFVCNAMYQENFILKALILYKTPRNNFRSLFVYRFHIAVFPTMKNVQSIIG